MRNEIIVVQGKLVVGVGVTYTREDGAWVRSCDDQQLQPATQRVHLSIVKATVLLMIAACAGDGSDAQPPTEPPRGCLGLETTWPMHVDLVTESASDLNGDGFVDMVSSTLTGVAVVLSEGDATYGTKLSYDTFGYVDVVAVGDLGGNSFPDLVVAQDDRVVLLVNQGDGSFGAPINLLALTYTAVTDAVVTDFDGDDRNDVVLLRGGWGVELYTNLGNATFAAPLAHYDGDGTHYPSAVALADVNGDALADVLLDSSTVLTVLTQRPNHTFALASSVPLQPASKAIGTSDFDGDGNIDVASLSTTGIEVLRGAGNATFSVAITIPASASSMALGDIDGDSRTDIVLRGISGAGNDALLNFRNLGGFIFSMPSEVAIDPTYFSQYGLALGHVDADATLDALVPTFGQTQLLLGNGDGAFRTSPYRFPTGHSSGPVGVASGDLDGDGQRDLVIANDRYDNELKDVSVLLGNGDGTFAPRTGLVVDGPTSAVAIADFDGDSRKDVFAVGFTPDLAFPFPKGESWVVAFLNTASGFIAVRFPTGSGGDGNTAIADFDNDGDLDVVVARARIPGPQMTELPGSLTMMRNDGSAQFSPEIIAMGSFGTLGAADLDSDGDQDLVAGSSVMLNLGDGTFITIEDLDLEGVLGDLNSDGVPDLVAVVSSNGAATLRVLLASNAGTFAPLGEYPIEASGHITIADIDNDTRADVLVPTSDSFAVLLGHGDGTLAPAVRFPLGGVGNARLLIDDLDSDGRADVVIAQDLSNAVFIARGNCVIP